MKNPEERPGDLHGETIKVYTGCGSCYVTINSNEEKVFEVFANMGKTGECGHANVAALTKTISVALRAGVNPDAVVEHLRDIRCPHSEEKGPLSCPSAIGAALEHYLVKHHSYEKESFSNGGEDIDKAKTDWDKTEITECPECGNENLNFNEGCMSCSACGWSGCNI